MQSGPACGKMIWESEDWAVKKSQIGLFLKIEKTNNPKPHDNQNVKGQWYNTKNLLHFKFPKVFSPLFISWKSNGKTNVSGMIKDTKINAPQKEEAGIKKW